MACFRRADISGRASSQGVRGSDPVVAWTRSGDCDDQWFGWRHHGSARPDDACCSLGPLYWRRSRSRDGAPPIRPWRPCLSVICTRPVGDLVRALVTCHVIGVVLLRRLLRSWGRKTRSDARPYLSSATGRRPKVGPDFGAYNHPPLSAAGHRGFVHSSVQSKAHYTVQSSMRRNEAIVHEEKG